MNNLIGVMLAGLVLFGIHRLISWLGLSGIVEFAMSVVGLVGAVVAMFSWF